MHLARELVAGWQLAGRDQLTEAIRKPAVERDAAGAELQVGQCLTKVHPSAPGRSGRLSIQLYLNHADTRSQPVRTHTCSATGHPDASTCLRG
jgi:hypothetical protein